MTLIRKIQSKIGGKAKGIIRDIGHGSGFYKDFYSSARGNRIVIYHGICKQDPLRFNTLFITESTFEAHLIFYKKHFNVVSLDDYYKQNFSSNKFNVCLTFDDGFANNHQYVLPLLKKYDLPAAFFITAVRAAGYDVLWNDLLSIVGRYGPPEITFNGEHYVKDSGKKYISVPRRFRLADELRKTGFTEKAKLIKELYPLAPFKTKKSDEDYWLQMTSEQIKEMADCSLVTIGSHGYYHNDLTGIPISDAIDELAHSKQYLENITGKPVNSVAFPYGSYNQAVVKAAQNAGYTQLLATELSTYRDNTLRGRLAVNPFISVNNQMYATVKGSYE
ncbi:MAG TPA: polysaccharide deacetylase family protein [Mucilaginibacter sp.]